MESSDPLAGTYSNLQHLLQLANSSSLEDQQKAAIDLAKLVDGTLFPSGSFGPLAHVLCKLVPSTDRTVAMYSAKAMKVLILDDLLRPQVMITGVPAVVCGSIKQWEDEILCLRELLGVLQTLTWDKQCVKGVLQADIISNLVDYIQTTDQEIAVLSLATMANILSYSDTLLLGDLPTTEALGVGMPTLVEILKNTQTRPHGVYVAACIANASFHPRLAGLLNQHGGDICIFAVIYQAKNYCTSIHNYRAAIVSRDRATESRQPSYHRQ